MARLYIKTPWSYETATGLTLLPLTLTLTAKKSTKIQFWGDNLMLHLKGISIGNHMIASSKLLKILHYK